MARLLLLLTATYIVARVALDWSHAGPVSDARSVRPPVVVDAQLRRGFGADL